MRRSSGLGIGSLPLPRGLNNPSHGLDLFVTVQTLEDTPAVLSLGKLCEEHGCTYEWVSGEKPHRTKQGNDNFVPFVVCWSAQWFS